MTDKNRKKQPDVTRSQLVDAALEIALDQGISAITLDAVASHSGVSKGGLQYHFRSKKDLLDAVFAEVISKSEDDAAKRTAADPEPFGRNERAEIRAAIESASERKSHVAWRMLLAAMMSEPQQRDRWSNKLRLDCLDNNLPLDAQARLTICSLAAEGIWTTSLLGTLYMSTELQEEVLRQLDAMTRPAES